MARGCGTGLAVKDEGGMVSKQGGGHDRVLMPRGGDRGDQKKPAMYSNRPSSANLTKLYPVATLVRSALCIDQIASNSPRRE